MKFSFDLKDLPVLIMIAAVFMIGVGAAQFHRGLGFLVCGILILLYIRPLSHWFK